MVARRQHDPVCDLLRSTLKLRRRVQLLCERYERLYAAASATTPRYSLTAGPSSTDQRKDALWGMAADASEELIAATNEFWKKEEEVHSLLSKVQNPAHVAILQYRYCDGLSWPQVLERLEGMSLYYSERHMFNLHGDALQEARRIWKESEDKVNEDSDRPNTDE